MIHTAMEGANPLTIGKLKELLQAPVLPKAMYL
jgi:hypothetical protein